MADFKKSSKTPLALATSPSIVNPTSAAYHKLTLNGRHNRFPQLFHFEFTWFVPRQ